MTRWVQNQPWEMGWSSHGRLDGSKEKCGLSRGALSWPRRGSGLLAMDFGVIGAEGYGDLFWQRMFTPGVFFDPSCIQSVTVFPRSACEEVPLSLSLPCSHCPYLVQIPVFLWIYASPRTGPRPPPCTYLGACQATLGSPT